MNFGKELCFLLLCISVTFVKANEIDFLKDLTIQNSSIGLQKDNGEMIYCYQKKNGRTNGQLQTTSHIKHHFVGEMIHGSFSITAQIKLKELKGTSQFVLFSVQRTTDNKKLFVWWINAVRRQVGITFVGRKGRTSLLYFSNMPFKVINWFQLTLKFRGFNRNKPMVTLYVNDELVEERSLKGNFRNSIFNSRRNDIVIYLADMWGLTRAATMPKICMRRLRVFTDTDVDDVVKQCPQPASMTKQELQRMEQRIAARVAATCDQAISKMMQQMQSMLNTCGVCNKRPILFTRPPPILFTRPPRNATGPRIGEPRENKPKQTLKSLVADPCPPGLNSCHPKGTCTPNVLSSGNYCKCNDGFAGNGYSCGVDSDMDGFPDEDLPNCQEKHCRKDNCIYKPNSGQENADGDEFGNACDEDQDNDGILNKKDNCPLHYNPSQQDTDGDRIGDACDNCLRTRNRDQKDTNKNGTGDACSLDIDGDKTIENDNCPYKKNSNQLDSDGDGIGDACDNCPLHPNVGQEDVDQDLVGDKCDSNIDRDKDGVNDEYDNCIGVINPGQLDTDEDGIGDECDTDDDNDGVPDKTDNCRLTANPDQEVDPLSPKYGLACKDDYDGDNIANNLDSCPENKDYSAVSFYDYQTINLDPKEEEQVDPVWKVLDEGREILQVENSDPGMAIGVQSFRGVDYYGTIYVDTDQDNDYFGLIFGYQSSSKFYTVMWKKVGQTYWDKIPFEAHGKTGLSIKVVDSITGPGPELRNALWSTDSTKNQVRTLWHDSNELGWSERTAYHWELRHRPRTGYIRFKIFDGSTTVIDTGVLHDRTYSGGRIGVMSFSQEKVSWSRIFYRCNDGSVKK